MDLADVLNSKAFLSAISVTAGALFWNFVALHRGRVRTLEYQVTHSQIGVTTTDVALGDVAVSWRGTSVSNLYTSTLRLTNTTYANITDLKVKVYTAQETFLLSERVHIEGTTALPRRTPVTCPVFFGPPEA